MRATRELPAQPSHVTEDDERHILLNSIQLTPVLDLISRLPKASLQFVVCSLVLHNVVPNLQTEAITLRSV